MLLRLAANATCSFEVYSFLTERIDRCTFKLDSREPLPTQVLWPLNVAFLYTAEL